MITLLIILLCWGIIGFVSIFVASIIVKDELSLWGALIFTMLGPIGTTALLYVTIREHSYSIIGYFESIKLYDPKKKKK